MNELIRNLSMSIPGFLLAIVFHEWAHGFMAKKFGDDTAERSGRLTMNPAAHIDPMGTIAFPLILAAMGGVMFGWAKPVPVNPSRFKNIKSGIFWVAFAGPLANIFLAVISVILLAIVITQVPQEHQFFQMFLYMLKKSMEINLLLAVFNLIPFPPLDGSKMVTTFLNYEQARKYDELQKYSILFFLALWFTNIFSYLFMPVYAFSNGLLGLLIRVLG